MGKARRRKDAEPDAPTQRAMEIIARVARERRLAAEYSAPEHRPLDELLYAWLMMCEALGKCPPDAAIRQCAAMLLGAAKLPADATTDRIVPEWLTPEDAERYAGGADSPALTAH